MRKIKAINATNFRNADFVLSCAVFTKQQENTEQTE